MKSAGVTGHFHGLRHRGAHNAWRAGAPIESISRLLGHSNLVQTQHYLGITDEAMWEAAYATDKQPSPSPQQKEDKLTDSVIIEELGTCVVKQQQSASDWIFSM